MNDEIDDDEQEELSEIGKIFDKHEGEFLQFDKIANRLSSRPDLHAFLLLDQIVPAKMTPGGSQKHAFKMIAGAEHDKIWLETYATELIAKATDEQILELVRCGVMYDEDNDFLSMFV